MADVDQAQIYLGLINCSYAQASPFIITANESGCALTSHDVTVDLIANDHWPKVSLSHAVEGFDLACFAGR